MCPGLRNQRSRDACAVRTPSFSDFYFFLCASASSSFFSLWIYCWGLWPTGQDTWTHICNPWAFCPIVSAAGETDSLSSNSRITGEGQDCPGWGQMSTLEQSTVARSQASCAKWLFCATVCVCVREREGERDLSRKAGVGEKGMGYWQTTQYLVQCIFSIFIQLR